MLSSQKIETELCYCANKPSHRSTYLIRWFLFKESQYTYWNLVKAVTCIELPSMKYDSIEFQGSSLKKKSLHELKKNQNHYCVLYVHN